ncbi:MAG: alcohol dehydrogenase catalytic domain-containing protein [Ruminococcaceae bacterium]|nr:alcohol dehydrogenase catalytic domain-containing protein [Oscillospiraceae bacterium]
MKVFCVEKDKSLSVRDIPMPTYNESQVLVKTVACGVCGSDVKIMHQDLPAYYPWMTYPVMMGHEGVGQVVEVGSKVTKYKVGDYVLGATNPQLPELGLASFAGGMAEYTIATDPTNWDVEKYGPIRGYGRQQPVLPKWIDPVDGTMVFTLREILAAVYTFGMKVGNNVCVFGCGPVGLTFIKYFSLMGLSPIIALDIIDSKKEEALEAGADYFINSSDDSYIEKIKEILPLGAEYMVDAVGVPDLINKAMFYLQNTGKMCIYGVPAAHEMTLNWDHAPVNWQLLFQQDPIPDDVGLPYGQVLGWLKNGALDLKDFISDYFDFKDVIDIYKRFEKKEFSKKVIIKF